MPHRPSPLLGMVLTVLFWGGNFTATKLALPFIPPLAFTALRFTVGTALLWLLLRRLEPAHDLPAELRWPVVVLGLVGNTLYQLFFIHGLAATTAINTSLILSAMPTVVTVTAGVLGLEVITARQRWALALATVGVVVVVASRGLDLRHGDWRGDLLILAAVGCWTAYTLGLRRISGRVSALGVTAWTMLTGTPVLLVAGLPSLLRTEWHAVPATAWGGLVYSTLLSLVAAYLLWSRAVQQIGASRAALFTCATPLIATAIATAVLGERLTGWHLLGGALIVGGVLLGNAQFRRPIPAEG
ncbi:MAG: DMT family transporter [Gemmatimonadales bacterium]|nr:DMT family transporter [Gemmatimonadota bacterium]MBP6669904.1 DMT family transporter [Gemmatimonadales bacterium]